MLYRRDRSLLKTFDHKLMTVYRNSSVMIHSDCVAVVARDQHICAIDRAVLLVDRSFAPLSIDSTALSIYSAAMLD